MSINYEYLGSRTVSFMCWQNQRTAFDNRNVVYGS